MIETQDQADTRRARRAWLRSVVAGAGLITALTAAVFIWTAPRDDVATPGPDATPEEVVTAYIDAVNARDFDTANSIDSRPESDLGRFSRSLQAHDVQRMNADLQGQRARVMFTADFEGGDGSITDGWHGYVLERDEGDLWHIIANAWVG